jgi:transposase
VSDLKGVLKSAAKGGAHGGWRSLPELSGGAVGGSRRKLRIVAECDRPGACLASVARHHDVSSGLLWNWRRQARRGLLRGDLAPIFLPVQVTGEPVSRDLAQRSTSPSIPPETPASTDGQIDIVLTDGTGVHLRQHVSLATLRRVLAALRG